MMGKIALNLLAGLFVGSTFWNAGGLTSIASLQSKVFGAHLARGVFARWLIP